MKKLPITIPKNQQQKVYCLNKRTYDLPNNITVSEACMNSFFCYKTFTLNVFDIHYEGYNIYIFFPPTEKCSWPYSSIFDCEIPLTIILALFLYKYYVSLFFYSLYCSTFSLFSFAISFLSSLLLYFMSFFLSFSFSLWLSFVQ